MVVGDISTGTDVVVIGGGPAGYAAAIRAGQRGVDVALVEREAYGGTCLNHGCIPSKALISATDVAHRASEGEAFGVHADPAVDLGAMIAWKDDVVSQLTGGVEKLCKANGVSLVDGTATFVEDGRIRVASSGDGQGSETFTFEHAIVATGSRPIELPALPFDVDGIMNSREALALEAVPDSLAVVGAGYIGMELAGVFAKLGTDVTVIEMLDEALPGYDETLTEPVVRRAEDLGITFRFETAANGWERDAEDHLIVTTDEGDESIVAERVLVAIGREPVTDTIDLDAVGLEVDEAGMIPTDETQRTANEQVFAVGDVAGEPMLAHVGMVEGIVASEVIAGEPAAFDRVAVPEVVFTDPEIARVGLTAPAAEAAGSTPTVGEFPFQASGRAMTVGRTDGHVRLVGDSETGRLLGGAVVGPEASELIGEIGLAVELGATFEDLGATIHTHPTLSEALMEAAEHAQGQAIHRLNR